MPLKAHEVISVFYGKLPIYNPQKTSGHVRRVSKAEHKMNSASGGKSEVYRIQHNFTDYDSTDRYPRDVIKFKWEKQKEKGLHPTRKPVPLLMNMIKTYTDEGMLVLDNVMGSGSAGEACVRTNRRFIGIEKEKKYFDVAVKQIENANKL